MSERREREREKERDSETYTAIYGSATAFVRTNSLKQTTKKAGQKGSKKQVHTKNTGTKNDGGQKRPQRL